MKLVLCGKWNFRAEKDSNQLPHPTIIRPTKPGKENATQNIHETSLRSTSWYHNIHTLRLSTFLYLQTSNILRIIITALLLSLYYLLVVRFNSSSQLSLLTSSSFSHAHLPALHNTPPLACHPPGM